MDGLSLAVLLAFCGGLCSSASVMPAASAPSPASDLSEAPLGASLEEAIPILHPAHLDAGLLSECSPAAASSEDIYLATVGLMVRIEDALRTKGCPSVALHGGGPVSVRTLYGRRPTARTASPALERIGRVADALVAKAAANCQIDWAALMDAVSSALRLMANQTACARIQSDILYNRSAWPSRPTDLPPSHTEQTAMGAGFDAARPKAAAARGAPYSGPYYGDGRVPFVRAAVAG